MLTLLFKLTRGSTEHLFLPEIALLPLDMWGYPVQVDLLIPQPEYALRAFVVLSLCFKASRFPCHPINWDNIAGTEYTASKIQMNLPSTILISCW